MTLKRHPYHMNLKRLIAPYYLSTRYRFSATEQVKIGETTFRYPKCEESHIKGNLDAECRLIEYFIDKINNDDVVFDIGADRGIYSVPSYKSGGQLVPFEANPITADRLSEIFSLNNMGVKVVNIGLGESSSKMGISGYRLIENKNGHIDVISGDEYVKKKIFIRIL